MNFRADIQGLRAIAILAVIVFHYNADILPGGFIGVDVFLVISGYLLTAILSHQVEIGRDFREILKTFYVSRIKRIAPAYYVLLVVTSLVSAILFIPDDFSYYAMSLEKSLYFFSNNYFAKFGDYFAPGAEELPLLHTWALAVEMQFYLIAPFILLFIPTRWVKRLFPLVIVALTLIAEYMLRFEGKEQVTYYSLYARVPEFLTGGWLALQRVGNQWSTRKAGCVSFLGLSLIIISAIFINSETHFPGISALLPAVGAGLIICSQKGWVAKLLSLSGLVWLGTISYSLYLWHWPVLAFLRYYTGTYHQGLTLSLISVVATIILSCFSYYFIEEVFRNKRTSQRMWVSMATILAISVAFISVGSSMINKKLLEPLPIEMKRYAPMETICHGAINGDCLRGIDKGSTDILLLGDSHAAMLNRFFDEIGEKLRISVRIITASSCVTIPGFDYSWIPEWAQKSCRQQIDCVEDYLHSASIIIIAASWSGYQIQSDNFMMALTDFLECRAEKGQSVLLLSDIPRMEKNPLRARRFDFLGFTPRIQKDESYIKANTSIKKLAEKYKHVQYIDLTQLPVFETPPLYKGTLIYFDKHHLNEIGSKIYGSQAAPYLQKFIEY